MKFRLKDIEFSDYLIEDTKIDLENRCVNIISSHGYYIPKKMMLGKVKILITAWSHFGIKKNKLNEFGQVKEMIWGSDDILETFALIQEIIINDKMISFNGWSKESKDWIIYEFNEPEIKVEEFF